MATDTHGDPPGQRSSATSPGARVAGGVGPFVTWTREHHRHAGPLLRTSRRQRKGLPPQAVAAPDVDPGVAASAVRQRWLRFWAPRRIGWWIAVLFMIGSVLFALGGAKSTWPQALAGRWLDQAMIGWVFFVGSLFFTSAGYLQWVEALNNDLSDVDAPNRSGLRRWRLFGWRPHNLGYVAASVQLAGTILFNRSTADALIAGLGWEGQDLMVWTPDVTGSICFLVASQLALMEVSHAAWSFQPRSLSWWITVINLLGSVLFMISALASFVAPTEVMAVPWLANFGTFAGALGFLVGAYLLIPELFEAPSPPVPAGAGL